MFLSSKNSFSLVRDSSRGSPGGSIPKVRFSLFLPNSQSFYLISSPTLKQIIQSDVQKSVINLSSPLSLDSVRPKVSVFLPNSHSFLLAGASIPKSVIQTDVQKSVINLSSPLSLDSVRPKVSVFLPNSHSFLLAGASIPKSVIQTDVQKSVINLSSPLSLDLAEPTVSDKDKRIFLKMAGIAGLSLGGSLLLPKKAHALIMGSSPTTGVVGVKNSANTRINPATEETLATVLKTSDLTFDAGALEVKVTGVAGVGSNSFSDSGDVARSALVDGDRHVQVDILSSALPTTASTETTLETISFGGFKFTTRLATVGDIDYVGEASIGTATSASSWRIKKVDSTTGLVVQWAGTGVFDQVWDNRAILIYT